MSWQLTPYAITLVVSAAVCIVLSFISWQWRRTRGALVLAFLMLAIAEWDLTVAFEAAAIQKSQKILWSKLSYVGIAFSPVLLFVFVLRYSHNDEGLTWSLFASLWGIPLLTIALALTNDLHHLIWTRIELHSDPSKNFLVYDYGPWFWLWVAYAYCMLAGSIFVLIRMIVRRRHTYRLQAALLLLAISLSWIGNGLYIADVGLFSGQDLTPLSFAFTAALLVLNIYHFRLLDLVPMAREAVIENMDDGVLVLDREDRIVDANPSAFGLLGLDVSVIGRRLEEALAAWPELVEACCDGAEARCEVHRDGASPRYLDVRLSRLYDRRQRFGGRLMLMSDITTRKELERQLRQAQKMEAIGRLAGGVAHEFNNLLTVINGYTEISLVEIGEDAPVHKDLEQVLEAGQHAAEITSRLLTFSRRRAMEPEVMGPGEVLEEMRGILRQVIDEEVELKIEVASDLGEVRVDRGRLEEAFINLVTNAQDAIGQRDHGEGAIIIEAQNVDVSTPIPGYLPVEPGNYVLIEVRDTGVGMSADVQERIFEPFFTTKEVGEGTGLGLAIVYGTVEAFGGGIEVQSEEGQGTSVGIYVPRI